MQVQRQQLDAVAIRRISIAVVALFATYFLGTAQAQASCGDYLHHNRLISMDETQLPYGLEQSPKGNLPSGRPCHGPSCRQQQHDLPAPTPVVSYETADRWMLTMNHGLSLREQCSFLPRLNESVTSMTVVFRLDRPPKA